MDSELTALEGLSELPVRRSHVIANDGPTIAGGDLEREALAVEVRVALPILAPVSRHCLPGACF